MNAKDVAIIGIGYWGKNLARNYYELNALHTVCELNIDRSMEYQNKFPDVNFTSSYQDILNNPEIKKVVIAVPTKLHYVLAKAALEAKKDVFVEKAMCNSKEEAKELAYFAESQKQILMVGHLLQYHPAVATIKKMIQDKKLGEIYHLSFSRLNFGSVGEENSALWAFAPHDISVLLALTQGKEIKSLCSRNKHFFSENFIDQSWLHLEFEENLSADIHVGWAYPYSDRKFTVMGTEGMVVFDDLKGWNEKVMFWKNHVTTEGKKINFVASVGERVEIEQKEPLKEECRHFLDCCEHRTRPITDGFEGLKVMEVLEMAKASKGLESNSLVGI